ncbi:MAG: hypothetical protein K8R37_10470 [Bacteroidales bacterium]|nr:hypothetical protein [Bacteroidales bacterium]
MEQNKTLLNLIAPKEIAKNFELIDIKEKSRLIELIFEEQRDKIPHELSGKEAVLDGFCNQLSLQAFPLKGKRIYLIIKRRRWKEPGNPSGKHYSNHYDLHYKGMQTTKEFGDFLKGDL